MNLSVASLALGSTLDISDTLPTEATALGGMRMLLSSGVAMLRNHCISGLASSKLLLEPPLATEVLPWDMYSWKKRHAEIPFKDVGGAVSPQEVF
jgi:hypothetical protein